MLKQIRSATNGIQIAYPTEKNNIFQNKICHLAYPLSFDTSTLINHFFGAFPLNERQNTLALTGD